MAPNLYSCLLLIESRCSFRMAMVLRLTTLGIITNSILILSIMTLYIMTLSINTLPLC
jgi:hypothetical protein